MELKSQEKLIQNVISDQIPKLTSWSLSRTDNSGRGTSLHRNYKEKLIQIIAEVFSTAKFSRSYHFVLYKKGFVILKEQY